MGSGKCRNRCIVSSGRSRNRSLHQFKYCFEHDVKLLVVLSGRMGPLSGKFYITKRGCKGRPRRMGVCPGEEESAGDNYSRRSPKGNRQMKGLLNQVANAAVKTKGSVFEFIYRRLVLRLGHAQAIGAIAHRLCRLIWMILHQAIRSEERGPSVAQRQSVVPLK